MTSLGINNSLHQYKNHPSNPQPHLEKPRALSQIQNITQKYSPINSYSPIKIPTTLQTDRISQIKKKYQKYVYSTQSKPHEGNQNKYEAVKNVSDFHSRIDQKSLKQTNNSNLSSYQQPPKINNYTNYSKNQNLPDQNSYKTYENKKDYYQQKLYQRYDKLAEDDKQKSKFDSDRNVLSTMKSQLQAKLNNLASKNNIDLSKKQATKNSYIPQQQNNNVYTGYDKYVERQKSTYTPHQKYQTKSNNSLKVQNTYTNKRQKYLKPSLSIISEISNSNNSQAPRQSFNDQTFSISNKLQQDTKIKQPQAQNNQNSYFNKFQQIRLKYDQQRKKSVSNIKDKAYNNIKSNETYQRQNRAPQVYKSITIYQKQSSQLKKNDKYEQSNKYQELYRQKKQINQPYEQSPKIQCQIVPSVFKNYAQQRHKTPVKANNYTDTAGTSIYSNNYVSRYQKSAKSHKKQQQLIQKNQKLTQKINSMDKRIKQLEANKKKLNIQYAPTQNYKRQSGQPKQERTKIQNNPNSIRNIQQKYRKIDEKIRSKYLQNIVPMYSQTTNPQITKKYSNTFSINLIPVSTVTEQKYNYQQKKSQNSKNSKQNYQKKFTHQKAAESLKNQNKKLSDNKNNFNAFIKALVDQVSVDEAFRNNKIWFSSLFNVNKYQEVSKQLKKYKIVMTEQEIKQKFDLEQWQNNPFFSLSDKKCDIFTLVQSYVKTLNHWNENISRKFNKQAVCAQGLSEGKIDMQKKGFIVVQDLVRFLNMSTGTYVRNRDVSMIFKRFSKRNEEKIKFEQILLTINH